MGCIPLYIPKASSKYTRTADVLRGGEIYFKTYLPVVFSRRLHWLIYCPTHVIHMTPIPSVSYLSTFDCFSFWNKRHGHVFISFSFHVSFKSLLIHFPWCPPIFGTSLYGWNFKGILKSPKQSMWGKVQIV